LEKKEDRSPRMRTLTLCVVVILSAPGLPEASGHGYLPDAISAAASGDQARLPAMPRGGDMSAPQVVAEAERIRATYAVPPRAGVPFDVAAQRRADDYYVWMARAGTRYRSDRLVSDALMRTYGVMGDYYNGSYPAGAWRGYVGANMWARRRWLYDDRSAALLHDLDRYSQAWAAIAYANGSWFWRPQELPAESVPDMPGVRETALTPVPVPQVDEAKLSAADREAWRELRPQFAAVSSRVHEARVLMEGLAGRLAARGLSVNSKDGATALSMQGFLVDAADLIKEREFARAKEALTRADYERNRLRGTTGQ
jgi:hypothetical protein